MDWQPIDAAPKDRGCLIGWVEGTVRLICWGKTSHVPLYGWNLADQGPEDFDLCHPTHWMPLPAAPDSPSAPEAQGEPVAPQWTIEGELCEMGDLSEGEPGFRIAMADGREITVTGLTRSEVPTVIGLFVSVRLALSSHGDKGGSR